MMSSLVAPTTSPTWRSAPPPDGDPDLHDVDGRLRARGWETEQTCGWVCGDADVRLLAGRPGGPAAELLGLCGDGPPDARWQAVRIAIDRRVVWSGPARTCPTDEVVRFVEDLLSRSVEELAVRYTRLG